MLFLRTHNAQQNTALTSHVCVSFPHFVLLIRIKKLLHSTDCTVEYFSSLNISKCLFVSNIMTNNWPINKLNIAVKCVSINAEHSRFEHITLSLPRCPKTKHSSNRHGVGLLPGLRLS
jgi:hypothetical protein